MDNHKEAFLKNEFWDLLNNMSGNEPGKWGKMNAQQMVEHVAGFFNVSTGKIQFPLATPVEHLPAYKAFLISDKQFRENTKAPVLPEEPLPPVFPDIRQSIEDLKKSVDDFFVFFKHDASKTTLHPAFGELNYEEWILLHHKHVMHHLKQFGLV